MSSSCYKFWCCFCICITNRKHKQQQEQAQSHYQTHASDQKDDNKQKQEQESVQGSGISARAVSVRTKASPVSIAEEGPSDESIPIPRSSSRPFSTLALPATASPLHHLSPASSPSYEAMRNSRVSTVLQNASPSFSRSPKISKQDSPSVRRPPPISIPQRNSLIQHAYLKERKKSLPHKSQDVALENLTDRIPSDIVQKIKSSPAAAERPASPGEVQVATTPSSAADRVVVDSKAKRADPAASSSESNSSDSSDSGSHSRTMVNNLGRPSLG